MGKISLLFITLFFLQLSAQENEFNFFGKTTDDKFIYFLKKEEGNKFILIKGTNESDSKPLIGVVLETSCFDRKFKYLFVAKYGEDRKIIDQVNQPDKEFGFPYPGTINEKLIKYSCGDDKADVEQFKITEVDLLPDLYIDMKNHAQKIAADYEKEAKSNQTIVQNSNHKPVSEKESWIDYYEPRIQTGDFGCSNIVPEYDSAIENKLVIINKGNTDVVVKLMNLETEKAIRIVYIKEGDEIAIKNIPQGRYYLKEAYGKVWKQKNINGKCIGEFTERAVYKKGKNIADFNIKKTVTATHENFQIPSYSLEIGVTFSKSKSGNYINNTISSAEFNK